MFYWNYQYIIYFTDDSSSEELPKGFSFIGGTTITRRRQPSFSTENLIYRRRIGARGFNTGLGTSVRMPTRTQWAVRNIDDSDDENGINFRRRQLHRTIRPVARFNTRRQTMRPRSAQIPRQRQMLTRSFRQRPRFTFQRVNTWSFHH